MLVHTLAKASIFTTGVVSWDVVAAECPSTELSKLLSVDVFLHTFTHASVLMTEDCGMQDALCTAFFHRFQSVALSLYFLTPLCKSFHLHIRRCEMEDGFDTVIFLKDRLTALSLPLNSHSETSFHHRDRREVEDTLHSLSLLRVTSMAFSWSFNTRFGKCVRIHG